MRKQYAGGRDSIFGMTLHPCENVKELSENDIIDLGDQAFPRHRDAGTPKVAYVCTTTNWRPFFRRHGVRRRNRTYRFRRRFKITSLRESLRKLRFEDQRTIFRSRSLRRKRRRRIRSQRARLCRRMNLMNVLKCNPQTD